jgi:hypothetical protein
VDYRYTFIGFGHDADTAPAAVPIPGLSGLQDRLRLSHKGSMWTTGVTSGPHDARLDTTVGTPWAIIDDGQRLVRSGGTCLQDIELRRQNEVYLDALGAQPAECFDAAVINADGTLTEMTKQCKEAPSGSPPSERRLPPRTPHSPSQKHPSAGRLSELSDPSRSPRN